MIDFHTHLDLYPDALTVARETSLRNEFTLAVTTSPRAWLATSKVLRHLPNIEIALGLHPEIVEEKEAERDLLLELVKKAPFIGETGLDGSPRFASSFGLQVEILDALLGQCSADGGKIISLHSRRAADEVFDLLEKHPGAGTPILHWFSGTNTQLRRAVDLGCWFSFGPGGIQSASGRKILKAIPLDKLLPESDGPFAVKATQPVMPWEAINVVNAVCEYHQIDRQNATQQLRNNANRLLKSQMAE